MSWFKWDTYLKQGKHKAETWERPLPSGGQTKRVRRLPNGAIGLRLHSTYCVIFHQDGTVTYNTGGWNTVTTRKFINDYGPVRVFSEKWQLRFQVSPTYTPPKVSKCRMCKGSGQRARECYGPGWCYPSYGQTCDHGQTGSHRKDECGHGQRSHHPDGTTDCFRCTGSGQVDYGSKAVYPEWDGGRYRFDPDNPTAGQDNITEYGDHAVPCEPFKPASVAPVSESYGDSARILAALMPDVLSVVKLPCPCNRSGEQESPVQNVVIHLNDVERWTRERIADWLDTLDLNLKFPTP